MEEKIWNKWRHLTVRKVKLVDSSSSSSVDSPGGSMVRMYPHKKNAQESLEQFLLFHPLNPLVLSSTNLPHPLFSLAKHGQASEPNWDLCVYFSGVWRKRHDPNKYQLCGSHCSSKFFFFSFVIWQLDKNFHHLVFFFYLISFSFFFFSFFKS